MGNIQKLQFEGSRMSESRERIHDFLKQHSIGTLATIDPNQNPHGVVIYYSVDEDFNVYFTTKRETKKCDNLKHNSHVMIVVYEAYSQTTAQITGIAEEITDKHKENEVFKNTLRAALKTSESGIPSITKLYAGPYVAYRIKPVQIRMAVFLRPNSGGYDIYETIDFRH